MPEKKTAQIKTRCTPSFKAEVEQAAALYNVSASCLIESAVKTCLNLSCTPGIQDQDCEYLYSVKTKLALNTVMNILNLDPKVPAHTKEKIRKELDKNDLRKIARI